MEGTPRRGRSKTRHRRIVQAFNLPPFGKEARLAKANYKKAIDLDPSNVHAKTMLAQVSSAASTILGSLLGGILMLLPLYFIACRLRKKKR